MSDTWLYLKRILFLSLILYLNYTVLSCPINEHSKILNEIEYINSVKNSIGNYVEVDKFGKCFDLLLRKGYFETLEFYLEEISRKGIKFKEILNTSIINYSNFLNSLREKFKFQEKDFQKVIPAIRWAQNSDYIFLEIKFSHRHDAPGNSIMT